MTGTTRIKAYDCDGEFCGYLEPFRDESGAIGWQWTSESGRLIAVTDRRGVTADPFACGNRAWELCEETPAHVKALSLCDDGTRFVRE